MLAEKYSVDPDTVIRWPYHKFMAVKRAYASEGARQKRMMKRLKNRDDDITMEWGQESFQRKQ